MLMKAWQSEHNGNNSVSQQLSDESSNALRVSLKSVRPDLSAWPSIAVSAGPSSQRLEISFCWKLAGVLEGDDRLLQGERDGLTQLLSLMGL